MSFFWHQSEQQPKRNYRFRVNISNLTDGDGSTPQSIIWWAKNFKPPSYSLSEATHDYMDNKYYWPGRVTWEDCTMSMVDPVSPNAVGLTNAILQRSGYVVKELSTTNDPNLQTISKANASTAMGDIIIEILTADGVIIEQWTLKNAWLKAASFSTLEYANDDLRTIDVTFRYDYAECDNYTQVAGSLPGGTGTAITGMTGQFESGINSVQGASEEPVE